MSEGAIADRVAAAQRLLDEEGIRGTVSAAGGGEIAAVRAAPSLRGRLAELAPRMRSLGFRYIALEPAEQLHATEDS